ARSNSIYEEGIWWQNYTSMTKYNDTLFSFQKTDLPDGQHTIMFKCNDSAGNMETTNILYFTVDMTPPAIEFVDPTPANDTTTTNTSIEINVSITEANLEEVKFNWNGTNYTIFNDSLVLMMNFDNVSGIGENYNNSNGTVIVDVSNSGNDGTLYVGADDSGNYTSGKYQGAYNFDGVDDIVEIENDDSVNITDKITLAAWVKFNAVPDSSECVVNKGDALMVYAASTGTFKIVYYNETDDSNYISSYDPDIVEDVWYYVVGVIDSEAQVKIYVDGDERGSENFVGNSILVDSGGVGIGGNNPKEYAAFFLNGTIDEVRIWNRALSASEVQQLYFTNLNKYDADKWVLYVNQSKNSTDGLDDGVYTYQAFAKDTIGYQNQTEERTVTIDTINPDIYFVPPTPDDGNISSNDYAYINVTATDTNNITAFIDWNYSLVGWWRFNNEFGENNTFFKDWSSYGNNGTCSDSNCSIYTTGKFGKALQFDGDDDHIDIGNIGTGVKTVSFWIKADSTTEEIMGLDSWTCGTDTVDDIDENTYNTVLIGTQCWMQENLDYDNGCTSIGWSSSDVGACSYYSGGPYANEGLLYQWSAAMNGSTTPGAQGLCPAGWHMPTDAEQHTLEDLYDSGTCNSGRTTWGCDPAGTHLSTLTLNGDNTSGFTALLAGYRGTDSSFNGRGTYATFWSSSESGTDAWRRILYSGFSTVRRNVNDKATGFSVRCLKDDLEGTYIEASTGTIAANGVTAPAIYVDGAVSSTIGTGWHHVVITTDTGINASDLTIGKANTFFDGTIDEVRIYKRTLTPEEINASYNAGLYRLETNYTNLADGTYDYIAYAQDLAGNINSTETRNITITSYLSCGTLSTPDTVYTLTQNVSSDGTCFTIAANNITIDGAGYTINYSWVGNGYGINNTGGWDNITIKNLNIVQDNSTADGTTNYAIYASGMMTSNITNNT
ncbi:MAG: hypothetical protein KAR23_06175, partial [Candidatus Aenigmarchaeota archaeon]|nr:hypothetical protein [Candidatus Aenigmarchaeota archaeon]